jgi:hypothetical protein
MQGLVRSVMPNGKGSQAKNKNYVMQLNQRYTPKLLQMQCSKQCVVSLNQGYQFTHGLQFHSAASADHCLERNALRT